jgi:hypothetical protein
MEVAAIYSMPLLKRCALDRAWLPLEYRAEDNGAFHRSIDVLAMRYICIRSFSPIRQTLHYKMTRISILTVSALAYFLLSGQ